MTPGNVECLHRGRFAPSPTGPLHFGSLLAAMGSYLQARKAGGEWLVRIEDLDPPREVPGAADAILSSLDDHGFQWDGKVVYQSTRTDHYAAALDRLREQGHLFACDCSRRDIAVGGEPGLDGPVYPGNCRDAGLEEVPGRALRFRARHGNECFDDALQGRICEDVAARTGDFVVRRRDGQFAYQIAVVVDDAEQGITEVVRGCDLLSSTPRQIQLQRTLGLPQPGYMHLPLALTAEGQKLSKQSGAEGLRSGTALSTLLAAFRCLSQPPPGAGEIASVAEFWAWAIRTWDPSRLAGRRNFVAPGLVQA